MLKFNGHPVNVTIFPDKTSQVWKQSQELLDSSKEYVWKITWEFENEGEFLQILQLIHLLYELNPNRTLQKGYYILDVPYMPYGRQDKEIANEYCFALMTLCKAFCNVFNEVHMYDVHNPKFFSDKLTTSTKFINTLPTERVNEIIETEGIDYIIFPDNGAAQRYSHLSATEFAVAEKVRDQLTGNITGMTLPPIPVCKNILVSDDICDGGRTFEEVGKLVYNYEPLKVVLYVSHGIFSKGLTTLQLYYDRIYTRNKRIY